MRHLSEIVAKLKLEALKPVAHDIELVGRLPCKHHVILRGHSKGKDYFIKIARTSGWIHVYQGEPTWFLEPVGLYMGKYIVIVTPWLDQIKPASLVQYLDCCSEMIDAGLFYLDWYDSNNFSVVDDKLKIIDLDCALANANDYYRANAILVPLLLQELNPTEAIRWFQKCQQLYEVKTFYDWRDAAQKLIVERRQVATQKAA
jgi:hypothetical protein